jgi:hypothetical protein
MILEQKKLNHIADIPLRLFEGAPEGYAVVGTACDETEDLIVIVFEIKEAV